MLLLLVALWRSRRWRGLLVRLLFFAGTLFPALGFINVYPFRYSFVADHFQYLASLGIITLASAGVARLLSRWRLWGRLGGNLPCLTRLAILASLTWRQSGIYVDAETLWRTTIIRNPDTWMACQNFGTVLLQQGQTDKAILQFQKALAIQPDNPSIRDNLGQALLKNGQEHEALVQFQQVLEYDPGDPTAHYNIGIAVFQKGLVDEAIAHFQKALEIRPDFADAQNNLDNTAWLLATSPEAAIRNGPKALALARQLDQLSGGNNPAMLDTLAAAYAETGQFPAAVDAAQRALALAQNNTPLAETLRQQIKLFQAGSPLHDVPQTAAASVQSATSPRHLSSSRMLTGGSLNCSRTNANSQLNRWGERPREPARR